MAQIILLICAIFFTSGFTVPAYILPVCFTFKVLYQERNSTFFIINIMKPGNPYQIIVLLIILCSCNRNTEWVNITYSKQICDTVTTACITTHQGTHDLQKCNIYMDGDTLFISFPPELPAYWGSMKIRVYDGRFSARFDGVTTDSGTTALRRGII